uniref:Uncharacterized protein n=1 Tax=Tanacetum cinerariifolium TaxID=118510 RepID=A0A6L2NSW1_TANCI|nr:hypothetical protein [Tanacetum cinerariifolium]
MVEKNKLDEDLQGTPVDAILYHGMIGPLMYLTSSRPDLNYAVCLCARTEYQPADMYTKPLPRERFNFLIEKLGQLSRVCVGRSDGGRGEEYGVVKVAGEKVFRSGGKNCALHILAAL